MNQVQLRDSVREDVPAILDILNDIIRNTTTIYEYEPRTLEVQMAWFDKKKADGMPVITAMVNGQFAGFGTYDIFRPREAYRYSVEHSIYVADGMRGHGIGSILMQELIRLARAQGLHTMLAGIDAENEGSLDFHRKHGFEEVGRIRETGYKFDRWLDLVFMQLML